jgi:hypothetical protein
MHKKMLTTIIAFALLGAISAVAANTSYSISGGALGHASDIGFAGLDFTSQPTISDPYYCNPIEITMGVGSTLSSGSATMSQNYNIIGDDQGSIACLNAVYSGEMVEGVQFNFQADIAPSFAQFSTSNVIDPYLSYEAFSRATIPTVLNSKSFADVTTYNKFYCDTSNPTSTTSTTTTQDDTANNQAESQDNQADTADTTQSDATPASTEQAVQQSEDDSADVYTPPGGPAPIPIKESIKFVPSNFQGDGEIAQALSESLAMYYRSDYVPEDNMEEITAAGFDYAKSTESNDMACQSTMIFEAEVKSNGAV